LGEGCLLLRGGRKGMGRGKGGKRRAGRQGERRERAGGLAMYAFL